MWATDYIKRLKCGETIKIRPHGNSMQGRIESGQLVTIEPVGSKILFKGDIVLCKVNGKQYLHLISAISTDSRYQISNNKNHVNGWTTINNIFGVVTNVE